MRFEGVLTTWNHDAGQGRISPSGGGEAIFVSLGAFPTDGEGARLDEALSFEIVTGRDGRKQAVNLKRLPAARLNPALREATGLGQARVRQAQRKRRLSVAAGAVVTVVLVVGGVQWLHPGRSGEVPASMRR